MIFLGRTVFKNSMKQYTNLINHIIANGIEHNDRTGVGTIRIFGDLQRFNLQDGFPLLTTKKMAKKVMWVELIGFIRGITNNMWYSNNGCNIWTANQRAFANKYNEKHFEISWPNEELGPIYGAQWRNFDGKYDVFGNGETIKEGSMFYKNVKGVGGFDQLKWLINEIKTNPNSRRMIVSAWNPNQFDIMCLPPCHIMWQVTVSNGKLNLMIYQRSVDLGLGAPFNWASYATLVHILAHCTNLEVGELVWVGCDVHIYKNHVEALKIQASREPRKLPTFKINTDIKDFEKIDWTHFEIENYNPWDENDPATTPMPKMVMAV
jgi:thymidylate synthase